MNVKSGEPRNQQSTNNRDQVLGECHGRREEPNASGVTTIPSKNNQSRCLEWHRDVLSLIDIRQP